MKSQILVAVAIATCSLGVGMYVVYGQRHDKQLVVSDQFSAKTFDLSTVTFLSKKQLEEHLKLYKGYVARRNEIAFKLSEVERSGNVTYTPYRALKIAETFARNGQLLHELYFAQLEGKPTEIGEIFGQALIKDFGSIELFIIDLKAAALASRGWVITAYDLSDKKIHNYVADAHNETIPVNVVPLFITDVYEHAYFMDFGTDRAAYLEKFLSQMNWQIVEERIQLIHQ